MPKSFQPRRLEPGTIRNLENTCRDVRDTVDKIRKASETADFVQLDLLGKELERNARAAGWYTKQGDLVDQQSVKSEQLRLMRQYHGYNDATQESKVDAVINNLIS